MTNLHQILQAIVTVLAVINPVVCGSLFLTLTPNLTAPERRRESAKVALNILIILMGSALVGLKVLSIFGISLDVFRVVGGMIIGTLFTLAAVPVLYSLFASQKQDSRSGAVGAVAVPAVAPAR